MLTPSELLGVFALVLVLAGIINSFAEQLLTRLCSISVVWHTVGTIVIVALMIHYAPIIQPASYTATAFNNGTPFESSAYVVLIGSLSAASTFTGATRYPITREAMPTADVIISTFHCILLVLKYDFFCITQAMTLQRMSQKRHVTHTYQHLCRWLGPSSTVLS